MRPLLRALAVAALGALAGATFLLAAYARAPQFVASMDTDPPPAVRGLYPIERDPTGLSFAWTGEQVSLALPGLDRAHVWTLVLRVKAGRGPGLPLPELTVDVDGVTTGLHRIGNAWQEVRVPLPPARTGTRGARLTLRVTPTFVPGPDDARTLGVVVDELRLDAPPSGIPLAPLPALAAATLCGAIFGAAFGFVGVTAGGAVLGMLALTAAQAAAITHGSGPYAPWLAMLPGLALGIAGATVLLRALVRTRLRNTAVFAITFSAGALFLKLLVLLHPDMPIGDALFQTHRFEWVRAGRWLFTSEAPGGYQFPYAIGLYIFSTPFAAFVTGKAGLMLLLRIVVCAADTVAGLVLYPTVAGATGQRLAAAAAVAAFHLIPLNFRVQAAGNLTNAFGQSLFVIALCAIVLGATRSRWPSALLVGAAAAAAMLSHTSTFAIALAVLVLAAVLLRLAGDADARPRAWPTLLAALAAAGLAIGLYYAHFGATYAAEYARITGELARPVAESDPGGRTLGQRAALVPYYFRIYYGWPLIALAAVGLATWRDRSCFTIVLWAWLGGSALFLLAGVVTPVDLRHYLAAFPAVAVAAGLGAAALFAQRRVPRGIAIALLILAAVLAGRQWLSTLA